MSPSAFLPLSDYCTTSSLIFRIYVTIIIMKFSTTVVIAFFAATAFAAPISDIYARAGKGGAAPRKSAAAPKKVNWSSGVHKANDLINIASGISQVWSNIKGYV